MAKTTVYLPDELFAKIKGRGIAISRVCQAALEAEIAEDEPEPEWGEVVADFKRWTRRGNRLMRILEEMYS